MKLLKLVLSSLCLVSLTTAQEFFKPCNHLGGFDAKYWVTNNLLTASLIRASG